MDVDADHVTVAYEKNSRGNLLVYIFIFLFFLKTTHILFKIYRRLPSPIHSIALAQSVLGLGNGIICFLHSFIAITCPTTLRSSIILIGLGCILLTVVISIQVFYIYSKSRPMRALLSIYLIAYLSFIAYVAITQKPTYDNVHCYFNFPYFIPLSKLCIDLFANVILGGAIIKGIREIALREGGTFWHRLIIERVYHIIIIICANTATAVIIITDVAKDKSNTLYFIDWIVPSGVLTYHLYAAQNRREMRRVGALDEGAGASVMHGGDTIPLTRLDDARSG